MEQSLKTIAQLQKQQFKSIENGYFKGTLMQI